MQREAKIRGARVKPISEGDLVAPKFQITARVGDMVEGRIIHAGARPGVTDFKTDFENYLRLFEDVMAIGEKFLPKNAHKLAA